MQAFSVGRRSIALLTQRESTSAWPVRARPRTVIATSDRWKTMDASHGDVRAWQQSAHVLIATPSVGRHLMTLARQRSLSMRVFPSAMEALRVALTSTSGRLDISIGAYAKEVKRYLVWRMSNMKGSGPVWDATMALMRRDAAFRKVITLSGPPQLGVSPFGFASIARSIVFQQLSGRAAGTIWARTRALMPGERMNPKAVLATSKARLRSAGLSRAKTLALLDLADHVASRRLKLGALRHKGNDEVIAALTEVRGIGPWSAQMQLMFALGRLDVWPVLDLGVRNGLGRLHGIETPSASEAESMGDRFRPVRSLGAWAMWRLTEMPGWPYNAGG